MQRHRPRRREMPQRGPPRHASNPEAYVVVVGCYAQLKPAEIADIDGVDLVLGAGEKFNLADHLASAIQRG